MDRSLWLGILGKLRMRTVGVLRFPPLDADRCCVSLHGDHDRSPSVSPRDPSSRSSLKLRTAQLDSRSAANLIDRRWSAIPPQLVRKEEASACHDAEGHDVCRRAACNKGPVCFGIALPRHPAGSAALAGTTIRDQALAASLCNAALRRTDIPRMVNMTILHEARFYEPLPNRKVLCTLCPHDCPIPDGGSGVCVVRIV